MFMSDCVPFLFVGYMYHHNLAISVIDKCITSLNKHIKLKLG